MTRETCPDCGILVTPLKTGELRAHGPAANRCPGGARPKPRGVEGKALRYIEEGRVKVVEVSRSRATAMVRGSEPEPYECKFNGTMWTCTCEARVARCTHTVAAALVTGVSPTTAIGEPSELDDLLTPREHRPYDPLDAHSLDSLL